MPFSNRHRFQRPVSWRCWTTPRRSQSLLVASPSTAEATIVDGLRRKIAKIPWVYLVLTFRLWIRLKCECKPYSSDPKLKGVSQEPGATGSSSAIPLAHPAAGCRRWTTTEATPVWWGELRLIDPSKVYMTQYTTMKWLYNVYLYIYICIYIYIINMYIYIINMSIYIINMSIYI